LEFIEYYNKLKFEFELNSNFTVLIKNTGTFDWPDSSGVYVIWEILNENEKKNNLYWNDW
jgi:hypothetical protein